MNSIDAFLSFDVETTGFTKTARIIEIACVLFEGGEIKDNWSTLLKPEGVDWDDPNVLKALEVNHITKEQLMDKPSFMGVFDHISACFGSAEVWVAHNKSFDLRMLNQEYKFHRGTTFPLQPRLCLDTMSLSNKIHPKESQHKLEFVAARWGVKQEDAHRASSDAITCGRILHAMQLQNALLAVY